MTIITIAKDPTAVLDYGFNWADWLATSETISGSTWTIQVGLTEVSASTTTTTTTVWLSGGSVNNTYTIANTISTSALRTDERSMYIKVEDR